jgi:hypothetical protein
MVLLFVVCGWREEAVAGVCLRTYLVHSTYVFLCTRARMYGKIVKPTYNLETNEFVSNPPFLKTNLAGVISYPTFCWEQLELI